MIRAGDTVPAEGPGGTSDFLGFSYHGLTISHLDALCHQAWNGKLYNGFDASLVGSESKATVLNIDIAPTILELAGLEVPASVQGRSLLPLLRGRRVEWRSEFFYEHPFRHPRIPMTEGVRGPRYKYVRYTSLDPVVEQLYDLKLDPREEKNLAGDPGMSQRLSQLRASWRSWRERVK